MIYLGKSGEKFIERVTDESLNEKAIKSFVGKTVTIDHPAQRLNAFNLTKYKKGTIIGVEKNEKFLQAQLQIEDPETVQINLGLSQGFTKASLTDFLVEETGISQGDVKNLNVRDNSAQFEISARYEQQLVLNLKGFKIAHRNVKLSIAQAQHKFI